MSRSGLARIYLTFIIVSKKPTSHSGRSEPVLSPAVTQLLVPHDIDYLKIMRDGRLVFESFCGRLARASTRTAFPFAPAATIHKNRAEMASPYATPALHQPARINDSDIGPQFVYRMQEEVENLERYTHGGYHPVSLGDKLDGGRYETIHKLGYGSFATVWLARDLYCKRYVSIKILTAHSSTSQLTEVACLKRLQDGNPSDPGKRFVPTLLDHFYHDGFNGRHACIVTQVLGGQISECKESLQCGWRRFHADVARAIGAKALLGLAYTHSCGIIHGGAGAANQRFS